MVENVTESMCHWRYVLVTGTARGEGGCLVTKGGLVGLVFAQLAVSSSQLDCYKIILEVPSVRDLGISIFSAGFALRIDTARRWINQFLTGAETLGFGHGFWKIWRLV